MDLERVRRAIDDYDHAATDPDMSMVAWNIRGHRIAGMAAWLLSEVDRLQRLPDQAFREDARPGKPFDPASEVDRFRTLLDQVAPEDGRPPTAGTPIPGWPDEHMLEAAMGLLANAVPFDPASGWDEAKRKWMDAYHRQLAAERPDAPPTVADELLRRRNPHCSNCGDHRGGPFGHEASECTWKRTVKCTCGHAIQWDICHARGFACVGPEHVPGCSLPIGHAGRHSWQRADQRPTPVVFRASPEGLDMSAACPHCPDGHQSPQRCAWGVYVGAERDGDGQPVCLRVTPSNGAHVANEDADWLWRLIRDGAVLPSTVPDDLLAAVMEEGLRHQPKSAWRCACGYRADDDGDDVSTAWARHRATATLNRVLTMLRENRDG